MQQLRTLAANLFIHPGGTPAPLDARHEQDPAGAGRDMAGNLRTPVMGRALPFTAGIHRPKADVQRTGNPAISTPPNTISGEISYLILALR